MRNKPRVHSILLFLGLVSLLTSLVVGCGPASSSAPPVIVEFSAVPSEIGSGEAATLLWSVTGATAVTIDQGIGDVPAVGTQMASPTTTVAYTLTATNAAGTVTRSVVITVTAAPSSTSFDTYTNDMWGYTISYPNDWEVDSAEPERAVIDPPSPYIGGVIIRAYERSHLPIEDRVQILLDVEAEFWDSFTVLDSKGMEGMWDWYVSCDYYWEEYDMEFHEEVYYKDTAQYEYEVETYFEKADYDVYPLSEIAETLTLLQEEAPPPAEPTTYVLSTNVSPSEAGSVSPSGGKYEENTQVTLTATVASGYTFDYWGGDTSGSSTTVTLTMDSDKSVTAHFKVIEPEPIRFSGHGDDVTPKFTLEQGITIITMTHDGSSNFAIKLLNDKGDWVDLLVNEIGAFEGSKAIGVRTDNIIGAKPGTHLLDVTADSNWEVVIEQPKLTEVKSLPQTFQGSGCGVSSFFTLNEGLTTFTMTHDGGSNFIVTLLGNDGRLAELLVNEIGSYDGKKAVGVKKDNLIGARPGIHVLSVEADGNWFVSVSQ